MFVSFYIQITYRRSHIRNALTTLPVGMTIAPIWQDGKNLQFTSGVKMASTLIRFEGEVADWARRSNEVPMCLGRDNDVELECGRDGGCLVKCDNNRASVLASGHHAR